MGRDRLLQRRQESGRNMLFRDRDSARDRPRACPPMADDRHPIHPEQRRTAAPIQADTGQQVIGFSVGCTAPAALGAEGRNLPAAPEQLAGRKAIDLLGCAATSKSVKPLSR